MNNSRLVSLLTCLLHVTRPSAAAAGVCGVRLPPAGAALGDRPVPVHGAAHAGLVRRAEGRRHGLPLPGVGPPGARHAAPDAAAGSGERRPAGPAPAARPRPPARLEGLQHAALQADAQQPG